ncbi:ATP-binding cassette domain-containing protein [Devosia ginsengisoli]|uniref:ATP-binding cassette domain-containing protein n=1 Tax=Devosia ginsengisoli TaxID=400770 RepID=UPI0026EBC057|nr:ABC transporter ATP-binding protein [Devosia ginsengisoli]MCR6669788.1 ABC transporter ATP-binding protein [Devosia ginsengisoli]
MTNLLQLQSVSKSYGAFRALDDLSLVLRPGQFGVLLGRNGAGKTTLFQLLTGLFAPDRGQIVIDGYNMARQAVRALARLGVVFQQPTMDLDLSVRQNLRFHARMHGMGRMADPRIDEELARIGLLDHADDPVRKLSGGNRRKVELARALLPSQGPLCC